jgi:hypothetical protein
MQTLANQPDNFAPAMMVAVMVPTEVLRKIVAAMYIRTKMRSTPFHVG